jgi:phage repressor protein C with HTH and peptisase S24 domain
MHLCHLSSTELAKRADVKKSFIYDVLSGKSANPSPLKLARLAHVMGVTLSSLVESDLVNDALHESDLKPRMIGISRINITCTKGANPPVPIEEYITTHYFAAPWLEKQIDALPEALRLITVLDDGMTPTLCLGDLALINTFDRSPMREGVFVLWNGSQLVCRRLALLRGGTRKIRVWADNPHYPFYELSVGDAYIIGRVVWLSREL